MPVVDSVDYPNRRIYLTSEVVGSTFDPIDAYTEIRALRAAGQGLGFFSLIDAEGRDAKTLTTFTPRRALLANGVRFVPFDLSGNITLVGEVLSKSEGISNLDCFDRQPLSPATVVEIDVNIPQVEIVTVSSGSGLDANQDSTLNQILTVSTSNQGLLDSILTIVSSANQTITNANQTVKRIVGKIKVKGQPKI